jgi:hypothetical protein
MQPGVPQEKQENRVVVAVLPPAQVILSWTVKAQKLASHL